MKSLNLTKQQKEKYIEKRASIHNIKFRKIKKEIKLRNTRVKNMRIKKKHTNYHKTLSKLQ